MGKGIFILALAWGAAAAAWPQALVEVAVADVDDFEAFRARVEGRCLLVGGYAYTAVPEAALGAFEAHGRPWAAVAVAGAGEGFLVLPAGVPYDGPARLSYDAGGGNLVYVMREEDSYTLLPRYAFNFLGAVRAPAGGPLPAVPFDPAEANVVERVRGERLMATVRRLQDFYSRDVYDAGNATATSYLEEEFRQILRTSVERQYFDFTGQEGPARVANVVARLEGVTYPEQQIVVGAHFDSKTLMASGYQPGADDNASGTAAVLECARRLSSASVYDRTLIFVAFNAEEAGLVGSTYYAAQARAGGDDIRAMINLDMVAYEPDELWEADVFGNSASYDLAELLAAKAEKYTPLEMRPHASGPRYSDHSPFWDQGYRAIFEHEGITDPSPYVHTPGDTVDTLNAPFFEAMTKALVATAYELAGANTSPRMAFVEPDGDDYADERFTVRWWDVDGDDRGRDASIALYWSKEAEGEEGTLLVSGLPQNDQGNRGSYEWRTADLPAGRYYLSAVIDDGVNEPYAAVSPGPVYVVHASRLVAYPNPVRRRDGHARVTFEGLLPGDTLTVYDLAGTVVFEGRARGGRLEWDTGRLASGVYLYRLVSEVVDEATVGKLAVLQ